MPWWFAQDNALSLLDRDDQRGGPARRRRPGHGVYTHKRALDLPGASIALATDSVKGAPQAAAQPAGRLGDRAGAGPGMSLLALWRHIARTIAAENALRQQMAFRTAMENSLVTGLRARDLEGRVTYVNPAFCRMVGLPAEELLGKKPPMPYWAPEAMAEYQDRFRQRAGGPGHAAVRDRVPAPRRRARAGAGVRGAAGRQPTAARPAG